MSVDWQIFVALGSVGGFAITFATFWLTFGSRLSKAESKADEAHVDAKDAQEKLAILGAAFSLYRETVAQKYIDRDVMREVEDRVTAAIDRLGDRLDRVLERAAKPHG